MYVVDFRGWKFLQRFCQIDIMGQTFFVRMTFGGLFCNPVNVNVSVNVPERGHIGQGHVCAHVHGYQKFARLQTAKVLPEIGEYACYYKAYKYMLYYN